MIIEWDNVNQRDYEYGVDRGLIAYSPEFMSPVIPWNGLVSVDEKEVDTSAVVSSYDGVKYANFRFGGVYQCEVTAFAWPDVFDFHRRLGLQEVFPGFYLTGQPRGDVFHFSFRSMINETDYKLHLVYNAMVTPVPEPSVTIGKTAKPSTSKFVITTVPIEIDGFKPTSHICADTRFSGHEMVGKLESYLYGTLSPVGDPMFPTLETVLAMLPD